MKINIITTPKVYVINRMERDESEIARFLKDEEMYSWTTDAPSSAEFGVEFGGRLCYMSFRRPRPGGNSAYIRHILEVGHGSVTEHAVWTLVITGISRRCGEQLTRQRVGFSPSQLSQRYVDETESGSLDVVMSPAMAKHLPEYEWYVRAVEAYYAGDNRQNIDGVPEMTPQVAMVYEWVELMKRASAVYEKTADQLYESLFHIKDKSLRRKRAREAARDALPNATETKIQVTTNARSLRHFIEMRGDAGADQEIRRLAFLVYDTMKNEAPNLFGDYRTEIVDEVPVIRTSYRKV